MGSSTAQGVVTDWVEKTMPRGAAVLIDRGGVGSGSDDAEVAATWLTATGAALVGPAAAKGCEFNEEGDGG